MNKQQELQIKKRGPRLALYSICTPVENIEDIRPVVLAMIKQVYSEGLDGMSANQAGLNKQVFISDVEGDHIRVFINPVVTIVDHDMDEYLETCASYDKARKRFRHGHVIVDAVNLKGERFILDTSSPVYPDETGRRLAARIQHEMEHMFGMDVRDEPDVSAEQTALADLLVEPLRWGDSHVPAGRLRPPDGSHEQAHQSHQRAVLRELARRPHHEDADLLADYIVR